MFPQNISRFPFTFSFNLYFPFEDSKYLPFSKISFPEQVSPLHLAKENIANKAKHENDNLETETPSW